VRRWKKWGEEEYLIRLNMTGPLDDFEYFLTSNPPLEEPDIIALLTLGVTSEHLSSTTAQGARMGAGAALQRRMETLAGDQLTGNITDFASRSFGKQIGLDRVGVAGDVFDMNKARFMAAKKFQDRLELKYTTSFKRLNDYEIQANYRLWNYLFLAGQTNQKNESQGDLKFRIKFE